MSADVRAYVAATARAACRAGFVEAFGHVSARVEGAVVITPTTPLARVRADELLCVAIDGGGEWAGALPLETPLHLAIYRRRPDVMAIVRTHSPYVVLWGARPGVPPIVHGLGALSGDVRLHDDPLLVADDDRAAAAARALCTGAGLVLAANGALTVGASLSEAFARAWYLEDRARVAWEVGADAQALAAMQLLRRGEHVAPELARATTWAHDLVWEGAPA